MLYCLTHANILSRGGIPRRVVTKRIGHYSALEKALDARERAARLKGFAGFAIGLVFCADGEEGAPPRLVYRNGYACPEDPEFWLGGHYRTRAAALAGLRALERFAVVPEALETYEVSVDADGWVEGFESG